MYTAIWVPRDGFSQAVEEFQRAGGKGLNITLPFKHEAWECAEELHPWSPVTLEAVTEYRPRQ